MRVWSTEVMKIGARPAREDPCKAETIPTLLWAANILLKVSVRKFSYL